MKDTSPSSSTKSPRILVVTLLAVILAFLFRASFLPGIVHFSNDGPLGAQNTDFSRLPQGFTGMWDDLNSIGLSIGAFSPCLSILIKWVLGPVGYSKFLAPVTLWILGVCAWFCFRRMKLSPLASLLGALAVALNSGFFSTACWGVAAQVVAFGMNFLALGLIMSGNPSSGWLERWARYALAGFAVGMGVTEGADNGAIFSLLTAAFVIYHSLVEEGPLMAKVVRGIGRTIVVAVFAAFIAAHTVVALVSTQVQGIAGTQQDTQTKAQKWDWATQWSLPKREAIGLVVPGLFGYRMNSPEGGNYWGAMGRDPAWDRYFKNDSQGPRPGGFMRFSGGGNYSGVLVVLLALWAATRVLRKQDSVFTPFERRLIWFWIVAGGVSLLLAFGRFAPFYQLLYALPYFSTIRNPVKFIAIFTFALTILFAYGVNGLWRKYMEVPSTGVLSWPDRLKKWWASAVSSDKRWVLGCVLVLGASLIGWLIYASSRQSFEQYLQTVQFDDVMAGAIANFSINQVGWFVLFFALSAGLVTLIFSGAFAGKQARWGGILLGLLMVIDLGRADQNWIVHWNYGQKYASNEIIDLLRARPYEQRVAILPFRAPPEMEAGLLDQLYRIEWAQHHFPYYNIQSLDIIQMPRMPEDLAAFETALMLDGTPNKVYRIARRWQLTNTRYLLGAAGYAESLNQQFDPIRRRFRVAAAFDIVPKRGIARPTQLEELTAVINPNGKYALFEFAGALPRAKLYSRWQVSTNDQATLEKMGSQSFDPADTVLVSSPVPEATNAPGSSPRMDPVEFTSYAPKDIKLKTSSDAPSVLLLNDKYDANWQVWVDGKQAEMLRCNYIMRGVYLAGGTHTVEFLFKPKVEALYVSLAAIAMWAGMLGIVVFQRKTPPSEIPAGGSGPKQKNRPPERPARTS